jgi:hypothetical protein
MRQISGNMRQVVGGMDKAMESMNLERVSFLIDLSHKRYTIYVSFLRFHKSWINLSRNSPTSTCKPRIWKIPCHLQLRYLRHKIRYIDSVFFCLLVDNGGFFHRSTNFSSRPPRRQTSNYSTISRAYQRLLSRKQRKRPYVRRMTSSPSDYVPCVQQRSYPGVYG